MFKKLIFVASIFGIAANAFGAKSIGFGLPGHHTDHALHIFIDKNAPQPPCINTCITFSAFTDDGTTAAGATRIERVIVLNNSDDNDGGTSGSYLNYLNRSLLSPAVSARTFTYVLKQYEKPEDVRFEVLATKSACLNPAQPQCLLSRVSAQGTFTFADLKKLEPTTANDLYRGN